MPKILNLFDHVYVVSLQRSEDRRAHIDRHFRDLGLQSYTFFDATDHTSPRVAKLFSEGRVKRFPPCFRCGQVDCGNSNCNNVLIPQQVAVFDTYLRLWETIADQQQCVLICEDDVLFHPWWAQTLEKLHNEIENGAIHFSAAQPTLLRLGWALGPEHDGSVEFCINQDVRMSNPCHALTSAYAKALLSEYRMIDHTADAFQHLSTAVSKKYALTVFPPIASELSWSTGEMASLIHPKEKRADYLDAQGEHEAAESERARIATHQKHMYHREFLVTGHPRTGTGYAASLLQQLGFDVGHEKAGVDGLSSWMFAADAESYPYAQDAIAASRNTLHWNMLLHIVRDPSAAVASIMRDNIWAPPSYNFRRTHILRQTGVDLDGFAENFERAVMSLVCWSQMILEMKPDFWFRLEDAHVALPQFLALRGRIVDRVPRKLDNTPVNDDKLYLGERKPKPEIDDKDWSKLPPVAIDGLRWYCERFGYPLPGTLGHHPIQESDSDATTPLRQQFLTPSGWERSRNEQRPVRADGRPLPWFTYSAIEFLNRVVDGGMRVFEYGAGYSTLWWQRAALVHSVDHDPDWVAELRPKLGHNVQLRLVQQGAAAPASAEPVLESYRSRSHRTVWDYPPERVVRRGLEDDTFLAYAAQVRESGIQYDVIIIDGMARRLCTAFAVECLAETGFIVLDNSNRSDYDAAYDILSERGFFQIPFWGLVPGADFLTCTSIFARHTLRLPDARFQSNSFGLPEY